VGGDCEDAYYSFVERWQDVLYANMTSEELAGLGIDESTWSYGLEHARLNMLTRVCVFVDCVVLYAPLLHKISQSHCVYLDIQKHL
jgi:hypothetical protein